MHCDDRIPEAQLVHPGEKVDDLQRSGLRIIQDPARFCFGMDAVLLTGFIQEGIGGRSMAREDMLDLGTGTGIIPLLMSAKSDLRTLTGLEIQPDSPKAIARHEVLCDFDDVAGAAERLLKTSGHFFLVHRPFRLAEIMTTLRDHGLEPKRMRLVYPFIDREPNMVLLDCVRGGRPRLTVEKPLIVYKEAGKYTDEIYEVYGY